MKKICLFLVGIGVVFCGCQAKGGAEDGELPPFRISMITTLTGADPFGGAEYKYGAELALEHMGGEINGRKINLVIADGPNQDATISEFERLYNDGSRCFFSGYGSVADRTFATMCDEMEVLYLSLCWDYDLIQGPSDYFFRTSIRVDKFSGGLAQHCISIGREYLGKEPKDLRIAIITNSAVEPIVVPFEMTARALGANIVLKESYPVQTKDFVPIITKLMNTEYDILVPFQITMDGNPFQKKMYEMGYTPPVTIAGGIFYDEPSFADLGNEISNGAISLSFINPSIKESAVPGLARFTADFEAKHGRKPLTHALQAYAAMFLYKAVLEQVDPSQWEDTKLLADTVKALDIEYGVLPWYWGVKFDELNNNVRSDVLLLNQWVDGDYRCIFPAELATREARIPWIR
ncbi:MAG: ABC transporter substrate-binding protein [Spirochaetales bacterium]|nr:ABC transporter substrate-binding protein [Spirochaetales bacterium]